MPALAARFRSSVGTAVGIAEAGEIVRALSAPHSRPYGEMTPSRLEALHEMAYLRIFVEWEGFLEATFIRMISGYESPLYKPILAAGKARSPTLSAAQTALYGGNDFLLWHHPRHLQTRGSNWFRGGPHELVGVSNFARLEWFGWVRHRVAHGSDDARRKVDIATIGLSGRRYRGASAGRFLRDWDSSKTPPERWLHSIGYELVNLAAQISP
jgi:hypothetical protein